jgi:hypothetical protein
VITCGGSFNRRTLQVDNFVVTAVPGQRRLARATRRRFKRLTWARGNGVASAKSTIGSG